MQQGTNKVSLVAECGAGKHLFILNYVASHL